MDFARGMWQSDHWTTVRLIEQDPAALLSFRQADDAIEVGPFTAEQKKAHLDNVLLLTDTGLAEGEVELTFTLGEGHGAAPGLFLPSVVEDGVVKEGVGIFVATYTLAVWRMSVDAEQGRTNYKSLARLAGWTTPNEKHTLTVRWSKAGKRVALKLDGSSVLVLQDLAGAVDGRVGVWGCHDICRFHRMTLTTKPTLAWNATAPAP